MKERLKAKTGGEKDSSCARRDTRRAVTLPALAIFDDASAIEVTILDLSYDGCRVEIAVAPLPGTKLKLSVSGLGKLDAVVRWSRRGLVGLCFTSDAVEPSRPEKPRGHDRVTIDAGLSLRRAGRQQYQSRVFDLTPSGCKVEFVERPKAGDTIWTKFDGLDALEAEVRWVDGHLGGVEFKRPIYPAVYELLLARLAAA